MWVSSQLVYQGLAPVCVSNCVGVEYADKAKLLLFSIAQACVNTTGEAEVALILNDDETERRVLSLI